jgi:cytochrome c biogenesis factor
LTLPLIALLALTFIAAYYLWNSKNRNPVISILAVIIIVYTFIVAYNYDPSEVNVRASFLTNIMVGYFIPAFIVFLGYKYKYSFSRRYGGRNLNMLTQDWFMIFCPFINWIGIAFTIILLGVDISGKIADIFDDRR